MTVTNSINNYLSTVNLDGGTIDNTAIGGTTPAAGAFSSLSDTSRTQHAVGIYGASGALSEVGPLTDGQLVVGSTGVAPVAATLTAGTGINITNAAGSITISSDNAGIAWTEVTGTSQAMAADSGYIANNAGTVTLTLPTTTEIGDTIIVTGKGAGGWSIAQNAGQTIYFGTSATTTGVTGSLASTEDRDSLTLVCVTANNDFNVISSIGNITVN